MGDIPAFNEHGVLPAGVYPCDEASFGQRFVEAFTEPETRRAHYKGFKTLRDRFESDVAAPATQWVDGSFVTDKQDPGDIDVVTFVNFDRLNKLDAEQQETVKQFLNAREATKPGYGCHTFLVPSCDAGHWFHPIYEQQRAYWRRWFGTTRATRLDDGTEEPGRDKGLVSMTLGNAEDAPIISSERGQP